MVALALVRSEDVDSLAMAMVASSHVPILLLDRDQMIVGASASFCRAFQVEAGGLFGQSLSSIGRGEWSMPQIGSLIAAALDDRGDQIEDYEIALKRPGRETRRLCLHARKLVYGDPDNILVLLTIVDVTDVRINQRFADDLVREKITLLEELQHRVANSLQIIASVLMQNARRVNSDETRIHLYEAHQRVMSVASLQKHLAATRLGDVEMRAYLTELCESIAASMIPDSDQLKLIVRADASVCDANVSMSLGLIVTELVINAVKHAFPQRRRGTIVVDYHAHGAAWMLAVTDDGVGVPGDPKSSEAGLGTSIVRALAKQLCADILVSDARPGTAVTVTRQQSLLLVDEGSGRHEWVV